MIEKWIHVQRWPSQALVLPRMQAHRGYCGDGAQENTLAAFRAARARGALMFECDVRLSKDQIPVIFHDEDLLRLAGLHDKVSDLTAVQLKDRAQVPTLAEVLLDPQVPRFVNIELKSVKKLDDALERKTADVVRKLKAENRVLFSSFNPFSLYRISLHLPQVPRALLVTPSDEPENHYLLKHMWLAPFFSFHCLHLDQAMVTESSMTFWAKKKIPVAVWTLKSKTEMQKYLQMGAISVITDVL
ncbi:MAG: glycerophosphodiester phosphodiesterase [Pseudobdellovibrionaceae bacterium]